MTPETDYSACDAQQTRHPHPALLIPEVAHQIAGFVTHKTDLASLALTCHTLSEASLDVLWAEPPGLFPLLLHLPSSPVEVTVSVNHIGVTEEKRVAALGHSFATSDWDAFLKRARRVVSLDQDTSYEGRAWFDEYDFISPDVFRELCSVPSNNPFPRMRLLKWKNAARHMHPFIRMIIGPSLVSLELDPFPMDDSDFLMSLETICPRLRYIDFREDIRNSLQEGRDWAEKIPRRSQVVRSWHHVKRLNTGYLDEFAIYHLAALQSLKDLRAPLSPQIMTLALPPSSFPALETVEFFAPLGLSLQFFVDYLTFSMLSLVSLRLGACAAEGAAFGNLIAATEDLRQHEKLESFTIEEFTNHRNEWDINFSVLHPLMSFVNLREVVFETAREVQLFNIDILLLIDAWPRLEILSINEKCGWKLESCITLDCLRCIVKDLPHLKELHIAIDATEVESGYDIGHGYPYSRYPAFRLNLLDSSIGSEVEDVAAYIADIFRERELELNTYQLAWDFYPLPPDLLVERVLYQEGWREVHRLLCVAQDTWPSDDESSVQNSCSASDGEEGSDESVSSSNAVDAPGDSDDSAPS